jgi:two-component system, OmpR family, sensor kinase
MNRLSTRLTLAMVAVTLFGIALIAALAIFATRSQLEQLGDQQRAIIHLDVVDALREHYETTGSWENAEGVILANVPQVRQPEPRGGPPGGGPPPQGPSSGPPGGNRFPQVRVLRGAVSYVLADANNRIVYDSARLRTGSGMTREDLALAVPIDSNGRVVGRLIATSPVQLLWFESQQVFLRSVLRNIGLAALLGTALAVAAGLLIGRALAQPLDALARSARAFQDRQWQTRAQEAGTTEMRAVARAFNSMASGLQQAEINRRNLTADIAHELRTPLTVVQGNLRAMLDGVYPLEAAEIATVYDETRLLSRLVDDLRELALAEAGQLTLNVDTVEAGAWLQRCVEPLRAYADERKVALHVAPTEGSLRADADRAGQVLRNLLMNAIRHTPEGGTVHVSATADGAQLRIDVNDSGEGVSPDDLPHIFDRFYRADKSRARASGGSGLGLPISKALVEAMGGRIGASSTPGQGSRFWFTLPR